MGRLAKMGDVDELKKSGAVDTLSALLEDFSDDPVVLVQVVRTLKEIADIDSDFNAKLARQIGGVLMVGLPHAQTSSYDMLTRWIALRQ